MVVGERMYYGAITHYRRITCPQEWDHSLSWSGNHVESNPRGINQAVNSSPLQG